MKKGNNIYKPESVGGPGMGGEPRFILIFIILILALAGAVIFWMWLGEIEVVVKARGIVRPVKNVSLLRTRRGGKIARLNFYQGKKVKEGQLLLALDSSMYVRKKKDIERNIRRIERKLTLLNRLKSGIRNHKNPFTVEEIAYYERYLLYKAEYKQLELNIFTAEDKFKRQKLLDSESVPEIKLKKLKTEYEFAVLNLKKFKYQALVNIIKEINAGKDRLRQLKRNLLEIRNNIDKCNIRAPISGTMEVLEHLNQGDYISAGLQFARIVPDGNTDFKMVITVQNKDIGRLERGQEVNYRFISLPFREYGTLGGYITGIGSDINAVNSADSNTGYRLEATIGGRELINRRGDIEQIRTGMLSRVRIAVSRKKVLYYILEKLDFIS